jgi:acyl-CoA thioester hydrolase
MRVRFFETDLMGIVHHATYLTYFEAARVDFLHKRGVRYDEWARGGIHLPVVEANVRYRKAARFDEWLDVETSVGQVSRVTVRFDYVIRRADALVCEGFTLLACVGDDMAPKRFPEWVTSALTRAEAPEIEWT